jgi:hypothetical protein
MATNLAMKRTTSGYCPCALCDAFAPVAVAPQAINGRDD